MSETRSAWGPIRDFKRMRGDYPAVGSDALALLDAEHVALAERVRELEAAMGNRWQMIEKERARVAKMEAALREIADMTPGSPLTTAQRLFMIARIAAAALEEGK